ncbi:hypothetical protein CC85DRAFT_287384 [Cutaneotrichosporon oleaginosum]|uniref:Uncharacterized protein n=1 Tax=Cutaneotrichosporon oleaginosum TaxID=879819 RepID=A0A0J1AYY9_9TREE|nr:uncharacterized protein CC85DRAFT_287384 [Cutaneotrichosporon oleaginosum]KLT40544.1 hypothetical protein CC85DRAFT_287384 [Cutaneotrichosporon oleaginosum]TXT08385.1 hypothetical protein COLE_05309 [Cutaneotrichosporon oleaginosum]
MLRPALQTARNVRLTRSFQTSAARRAAHGDSKHDTHESFFTGPWIQAGIIFAFGVTAYNFLPSPKEVVASPTTSNSALEQEAKNDSAPWLTRFLAGRLAGAAEQNEQYNDKHLALTIEAADQRLLFNEAERPKVRRLKYPSLFEQQSPYLVGAGTTPDLSKLVIKSDEQ